MQPALDALLSLLDLENLDLNLFRGRSPEGWSQRVFGGQVLAQSLVAAGRTVEDRDAHSFHSYFLRAGDPTRPIVYQVDRIRDGRSFTTRRVTAIQAGRAIFHLEVSFQKSEKGHEHQDAMPEVPGPETLPNENDQMRAFAADLPEVDREWFERDRPIELRFITDYNPFAPGTRPPRLLVWVRADGTLPDSLRVHQCVLAYASDLTLLDSALFPHNVSWTDPSHQVASLDHAMWFHRPFRADQWLLYVQESTAAAGARGFSTGRLFTREGSLVASVAQEGLIRPIQGV